MYLKRIYFQPALTANRLLQTDQCPVFGSVDRRSHAQPGAAGNDMLIGGVKPGTGDGRAGASPSMIEGKGEIAQFLSFATGLAEQTVGGSCNDRFVEAKGGTQGARPAVVEEADFFRER